MARPRDPAKNHNLVTTRVNDATRDTLQELSRKSGKTLAEMVRRAILAGLPIVKRDMDKPK